MTNDDIRTILAEKGITTDGVTLKQLMELHDLLSEEMQKSGCFRGTFAINDLELDGRSKFLTCKADYFDNREAVSFNSDGFIGMAGWASSENLKPIQTAVMRWAEQYT